MAYKTHKLMTQRKAPRPQKWDNVERSDYSRLNGSVTKIHAAENKVEVTWNDGKSPEITQEHPGKLAITRRIGTFNQ